MFRTPDGIPEFSDRVDLEPRRSGLYGNQFPLSTTSVSDSRLTISNRQSTRPSGETRKRITQSKPTLRPIRRTVKTRCFVSSSNATAPCIEPVCLAVYDNSGELVCRHGTVGGSELQRMRRRSNVNEPDPAVLISFDDIPSSPILRAFACRANRSRGQRHAPPGSADRSWSAPDRQQD